MDVCQVSSGSQSQHSNSHVDSDLWRYDEARLEPPSRHPWEPFGGGSQKRLNIHFSLLIDVFHIYLDARERFVTGRHNSNS